MLIILFSPKTKNISLVLMVFVFLFFILDAFSQNQVENSSLKAAQRSWAKQDKSAKKKFESLLTASSKSERLKSICHYYLGVIAIASKDYANAKNELIESLAYKFFKGEDVIFSPEPDKDSIVTGQIMTANRMRYNTYDYLKNVCFERAEFKEALVWAKRMKKEEYLITESNTSLAFYGSKRDFRQVSDFRLSDLYDKLQIYDTSSFILMPYCLGKNREAAFHLSYLKQRLSKAFSPQQLKEQSSKMIESISEESKTSSGVKVKWFNQEMVLYSAEITKLRNRELIIDFIKKSDLYKFMQGV
jgi:hypothetical protein